MDGSFASSVDVGTMVWSHHWPDQHDRCVHVGDRWVCRRCLVLYPVALAVLLLSLLGASWPVRFDTIALFTLPFPMVLDFVGEQLGLVRYSPRRQMIVTALSAPALGRSLGRYLDHQGDRRFWSMTLFYGGICGFVLLCRHIRDSRLQRQRAQVALAADPRTAGFADREAFLSYYSSVAAESSGGSGRSPVSSNTTN